MSLINAGDRTKKHTNHLAHRARMLYIGIPFITSLIFLFIGYVILTSITGDFARSMAQQYSIEAAANFKTSTNQHFVLMQQVSRSTTISRWLANENDPEAKALAFEEIMGYAVFAPNIRLMFTSYESLQGYDFNVDLTLERFVPWGTLAGGAVSQWFYDTRDAEAPFIINVQRERPELVEDDIVLFVWSNHRMYYQGRFIGVVTVGSPFDQVFNAVFGNFDVSYKRGYIIDRNGAVRVDSAELLTIHELGIPTMPPIPDIEDKPCLYDSINNLYQLMTDGIFSFGAYVSGPFPMCRSNIYSYASISPIIGTDWSVVVLSSQSAVVARRYIPLIIGIFVTLILSSLVGNVMVRRLALTPLFKLTQNTQAAANLSTKMEFYGLDRYDEIGDLARTIKLMRSNLEAALDNANMQARELREINRSSEIHLAKIEMMVDSAKLGLWEIDFRSVLGKGEALNLEYFLSIAKRQDVIKFSDSFRQRMGFSDENDFPNLLISWIDRLHLEDKDYILKDLLTYFNDRDDEAPFTHEYWALKKNGEYGYFKGSCVKIYNVDGTLEYVLGTLVDETESRNILMDMERRRQEMEAAHQELSKANALNRHQLAKMNLMVKATNIGLWDLNFQSIFSAMPDEIDLEYVLSIQNQHDIITFADSYRQLIGFSEESEFPNLITSWFNNVHPDDRNIALGGMLAHLNDRTGRTFYNREYRLLKSDGEYGYFRVSCETIRDHNGKPRYTVGSLIDETERKKLMLEMEDQRIAAEAANIAKSVFLRTVSHELRTPLNAILGISEIHLHNEMPEQDIKEAFSKIYLAGDILLKIINDLLDVSKMETGKLELEISDYDIASMLADTVQLNVIRIGSKPIEFDLNVDENVPLRLLGDELRIKQILNNLLSNAFKYTEEGTVKMTVHSEAGNNDDNVKMVFTVTDTGQGMTEEQVSLIFDEYTRFNTEGKRIAEGIGLGMSITGKLVKLMDGEISIISEPGKGSTFIVRLMQGRVGDEVLGKELTENLHNARAINRILDDSSPITYELMPYGSILIVDDVETNIYVARGLLAPYGLKIEAVDSGFGAIEKIEEGNVYDIIFMDHMMPKMDGIEATKKIREMGYTHPIVALTANATAGQAEVYLATGFDDFVSKPIDTRQMNAVLNRLIRDKQPPEVIEAAMLQAIARKEQASKPVEPLIVDPLLAETFLKDARKSLLVLESISNINGFCDDENIRNYIIHVHGMKSALLNIGKIELSNFARKLEIAARDGDIKTMMNKTQAFIDDLKELVEQLTPKEDTETAKITDEDPEYLREKLIAIKAACENYDDTTVYAELARLSEKQWCNDTKAVLKSIREKLFLDSDFEAAAQLVDTMLTG